ncbi:MAG: glycosyltransferase family 4 protein [Solirubrobacterales bacterium]|nr:glycosyltransferase family 4 protein [Solirubrobacterales bacterium]MBV9472850.1 glycosyltransferase family 4 protein [Solirubrobacterales bacterium]
MRVLIDTTFVRRAPYSGTAVYLNAIGAALSELGGVEVVEACNERRRSPAGGGLGSVRNMLADRHWVAAELPRLARQAGAQLIHHPLPAQARGFRGPQVLTVHDLAFERLPQHFKPGFRRYAHLAHRAASRAAAAVICVSQTTAADVIALWGVPSERIVVAPHGPGQELAQLSCPRAAAGADPGSHFLYVGDDEPRKDLPTLLSAYEAYRQAAPDPLPLVLAGSAEARGRGVRCEHHPSRERLAELYREAVALVHASLYEGFGLTALEAMSVGTPVIAAPAPGVIETCGEAARYYVRQDPRSLALAMLELQAEPAMRAELSERGRRRAAAFSWASSARAHLDAYSLALGA